MTRAALLLLVALLTACGGGVYEDPTTETPAEQPAPQPDRCAPLPPGSCR